MSYQVFYSLQAKQTTIITNKQDIYELPHDLSNDLGLNILRN